MAIISGSMPQELGPTAPSSRTMDEHVGSVSVIQMTTKLTLLCLPKQICILIDEILNKSVKIYRLFILFLFYERVICCQNKIAAKRRN